MTQKLENICFSLQETCSEENEGGVISYDELVKEVDLMEMSSIVGMDDYIAMEIDYQTNYLKKDLERIADYYEISKRKKKKEQLAEDIVVFEKDPENVEIVFQRKKLWLYVEEIKCDKYLSKFLIFN